MSPSPAAGTGSFSHLLPRALVQRRRRRWVDLLKYGVGIFLLYFLSRLRVFEVHESTHLRSLSDPAIVWEFLADFNNMKELNPTIIDFEILSDKGLYDDWHYTVKYTEFLHNAPNIKNVITADFHVKKTDDGYYSINSVHTTCFFYSLYCVQAWGKFEIFNPITSGVNIQETVTYECPLVLFWFCSKEATFQRQKIKENLIQHFDGLESKDERIKQHQRND